nr:uncharacterized protein LOC116942359 isoform X3 [Petromyzon marinus]XP_032810045.1 uncharacterized protein LOC116942359 isoform X3 [Petromyzon marinus]XP_032810047.1 uncharacterized protein LOC116942359 isoform X3 [Petromyzon marinus]XP_032810048.1 uncharacterized protein LOC116942359 isoform X3 [Petromyzon marinus]
MRKIILGPNSIYLYEGDMDTNDVLFFHKHRDVFKRMWHEQGNRFWKRFLLGFRTFCEDLCPQIAGEVTAYFLYGCTYIEAQYCQDRYSNARRYMEDVFNVAKNRHLAVNCTGGSVAWDPFYMKETRETFRNLFGSPGAPLTLETMCFVSPLFIQFGKSVCNCLRYWIEAEKCDSSDESYWSPEFVMKYGMDTDSIKMSDGPLNIPKRNKKSKSKSKQESSDDPSKEDLHTGQETQFSQQNTTKAATTTTNYSLYTPIPKDTRTTETKKEDVKLSGANSDGSEPTAKHVKENASKTTATDSYLVKGVLKDFLKLAKRKNFDAIVEEDLNREARLRNRTPEDVMRQVVEDILSEEDHVCWCFKDATECHCDSSSSIFCQCRDGSDIRKSNRAEVASLVEKMVGKLAGMNTFNEASTAREREPSSAKSEASTNTSDAPAVDEHGNKKAKQRQCDQCKVMEPKPKLFKKCQRCYDEHWNEPKYYCSRECQVAAWKSHRKEHAAAKRAPH